MQCKCIVILLFFLQSTIIVKSQSFFAPSDTLNKNRFYALSAFGAVTYSGFSIGLYNTWYKKYQRESFHIFNDNKEWSQMDKFGHVHSAYFQSLLTYKGAKWTGLSENNSILTGMICGTLFQTTIEVMDGFSSKWGFSIGDIVANNVGISTFALQQKLWHEQRISIKVSSIPTKHPSTTIYAINGASTTIAERANELFGSNYFERFLKDYNAQTYWASIHIKSFIFKDSKWPTWLNLAVGYGAENLYGGFANEWNTDGNQFIVDSSQLPRYRQFYIGLDLDLNRIKTHNHFVQSLFSVFSIFKIPSPAIEITTTGEIKFHIFR